MVKHAFGTKLGLAYTGIRVKDVKESVGFYTKTMGMKFIEQRSPVPGEITVMLQSPGTGQRLRLMWYHPKEYAKYAPYVMDGVELDHLLFKVKDAKKEYAKLVRKGCPVAMPLFESPSICMGFVKDPNGIWVGVVSDNKGKK